MTEEQEAELSAKVLEERLPQEMRDALDLVSALLLRVKLFTKKSAGDWMERIAYIVAGFGIFAALQFWIQYQVLLSILYGGG